MIIKRHKFKGLILMLGALLTLGFQPLLAQAKTTDVDSHFSVEMVETSDSKVGGEAVQVTVTNKTNQTGKNMLAKVDLPKEFAAKLGKTSVTETVGTLAAGESKSFIISLSDGSTQALPTTGSSLPTTGERFASLTLIVGFILLISLGVILRKRKLTGLLLALLVVTGGSVVVDAATTHHVATHTHQVTVAGQTLTFKTHVSGDFESSDENPIPTKYTVAFDLNYDTTETVASQEVVANALATQPTVPERSGYSFEGWYAKADLSGNPWNFGEDLMPANDLTLYAKWEELPGIIVENKTPGSEFEFAGSQWRILNPDIDEDNSNGYQALIIKVNALTQIEATGSGAVAGYYNINFRDGGTYFSSVGRNGYEAGTGNPAYLKGAIDYYYTNTITTHPNASAVLPVSLNNPTYTEFTDTGFTGSATSYNDWTWDDWCKDTRFSTTPTSVGTQQAFALSYGDINTYIAGASGTNFTSLLDFSGSNVNNFWLRSAGYNFNLAGIVDAGNFSYYNYVTDALPVRPALFALIR